MTVDNPYNQTREGALKGNGGLNYSERTKGLSETNGSMYKYAGTNGSMT